MTTQDYLLNIQIKSYYQHHIDSIINAATNRYGEINIEKAKSSITRLWFCHFVQHHSDLDSNIQSQMWSLFDKALYKLDNTITQIPNNQASQELQATYAFA